MENKSIIPLVNKLLSVVIALSFVAIFVTIYLSYMHYVPEASEFCTIDDTINCDIVNKSKWSYIDFHFFELPVSILGLITYLIFFFATLGLVLNWPFQKIHKVLRRGVVIMLLRILSVIGVLFSLYLSYVEAFILKAWCLLCVTQQFIIIGIMIMFFVIKYFTEKQKNDGKICEFC